LAETVRAVVSHPQIGVRLGYRRRHLHQGLEAANRRGVVALAQRGLRLGGNLRTLPGRRNRLTRGRLLRGARSRTKQRKTRRSECGHNPGSCEHKAENSRRTRASQLQELVRRVTE